MKSKYTDSKPKLPPYLLELVRAFRKKPTTTEKMMWACLRERRLHGFKFRRQHPIGRYIADFYCHEAALIIELDGHIHDHPDQREYDEIRTQELQARALTVVRFRNDQIKTDLATVLQEIAAHLPSAPNAKGATEVGT